MNSFLDKGVKTSSFRHSYYDRNVVSTQSSHRSTVVQFSSFPASKGGRRLFLIRSSRRHLRFLGDTVSPPFFDRLGENTRRISFMLVRFLFGFILGNRHVHCTTYRASSSFVVVSTSSFFYNPFRSSKFPRHCLTVAHRN